MATDKERERFLSELKLNEVREDPERMQLAQSVNARADALMQEQGITYPEAVKLAAQKQGAAEPSVGEVEEYMKEHEIEDFGQATREVARERGMVQQPVDNSVGGAPSTGSSPTDEEAEIKRIAKERGYDL